MAAFGIFLSKKYWKQISVLGECNVRNKKGKGTKYSFFKIEITKVTLLFQMFYSLVPKIEITIWTKLPKSSHCGGQGGSV